MSDNTRKIVTICADGTGEYTTLSAAAAAQDPALPVQFVMGPGVYHERPFLELADYVITGTGTGKTVISAGVGGFDPWPGEAKTGTFRSWTAFLGGGSARVEHLTIENTAGDGAKSGQALAVYADAARVCMVDVALHGNQDTLFTAPLPLTEREPNGFRGPRENAPRLDTGSITGTAPSAATSISSSAAPMQCSTIAISCRWLTKAASAISPPPTRHRASRGICLPTAP